MIALQKVQESIEIAKQDMQNWFPRCGSTVIVTLWEDNDYRVECRHGNADGDIYISESSKDGLKRYHFKWKLNGETHSLHTDENGIEYAPVLDSKFQVER